jgi:methionine-rich copper-binding protein CopC
MKRLRFRILTVLAAIPVVAFAHGHLQSSTPADGSVVAVSPKSVMLMFSEPARLTALKVQGGDEQDERKLGPLPEKPGAHLMVPAPQLAPGAYTIRWRALGADNHVMSGTIRFTLSAGDSHAH